MKFDWQTYQQILWVSPSSYPLLRHLYIGPNSTILFRKLNELPLSVTAYTSLYPLCVLFLTYGALLIREWRCGWRSTLPSKGLLFPFPRQNTKYSVYDHNLLATWTAFRNERLIVVFVNLFSCTHIFHSCIKYPCYHHVSCELTVGRHIYKVWLEKDSKKSIWKVNMWAKCLNSPSPSPPIQPTATYCTKETLHMQCQAIVITTWSIYCSQNSWQQFLSYL